MRFAISTSPQRTDWNWLLETWLAADDLPTFESGWTFDHFYPLFGDSTEDCFEGWISLTALLAATKRLRGGVLVTGILYRQPGLLANMACTLDHTSGGRLELGVGAGWNEEECDAYGIDLGTMDERFDRFEEAMAVIDSLLTNDRTNFSGEHFTFTDAMNNPKPVQAPLPICVGGGGLRRTIPAAAKYAQHWNYGTQTMSVDDFLMRKVVFNKACEAEGRNPDDITISTMLRVSNDTPEAHAAMVQSASDYAAAGVDLGIVSIPKHLPPEALANIAGSLDVLADH